MGRAKTPRQAQQAIKEQRAARGTAESKKNQSKNTKNTQHTGKNRRQQQRAKRDNHGFVLILCNNAILFPTFSCTIPILFCPDLAEMQYPLVH